MTGLWQHFRQLQARRQGRRDDKREEAGFVQQWYIRLGPQPAEARLKPDLAALTPLYPPNDRFWADPFLWVRDGRYWLFVEEYPFATRRGVIACMEVSASGEPLSPMQTVVDEPDCHLSYPFLIEVEGELYMLPEKSGLRVLDAYRCVEFPHRWVREKRLFADHKFADATIFAHEDLWYCLTSAKIKRWRINDAVFGFTASHPLADNWTPLNGGRPLVHDLVSARPAGPVFVHEGRLYRPSQNCMRRYGYGLNINRIESLLDGDYRETIVHQTLADVLPGNRAVHHMDWRGGLMVMDAQRLLPLAETLS
jgi:hypothetical protein